jgi:hypothetical protein
MYAFWGCTSLNTLNLGDTPPKIDLMFYGLPAAQAITVTVPAMKKGVYETAYAIKPWAGGTVTIVER